RIDAEPHVNEHTAGRRRFPVVGAELARPCRPSAYCVWHYIRSYFFTRSMRRLFERRERNEPALAIGARTTGHRDREDQIERCNLPLAAGTAGFHRDSIRLEQVLRRVVLAVLFLDSVEDRELAPRAHVHFELPD